MAVDIRIRADFSSINTSLRILRSKIGNTDALLTDLGVNYMAKGEFKDRFKEGGRPKWKKHADATIKRHGAHKLLTLSGALRESVIGGKGFFKRLSPKKGNSTSIVIGSYVDYAFAHDNPAGTYFNTGKSSIPGRPWSMVTQKNIDTMRDMSMKWVRKKIKESGIKGL